MHSLVLDLWTAEAQAPAPALVRMPLDGGALLACFPGRASGGAAPRWIAKTASGAAACRRLQAEAQALAQLEPVAHALGIPLLLGWRIAGEGDAEEACLAQTGVGGTPLAPPIAGRHPRRKELARLRTVLGWLARFQNASDGGKLVQLRAKLAEVAVQVRARVEACAAELGQAIELAPYLPGLAAAVRATPEAFATRPAALIHGDFWTGNVLVESNRLTVVDWSGLGEGSALDDAFTWLAEAPARASGSAAPAALRAERWRRVFFSPGVEREVLRRFAADRGYSPAESAAAFEVFLLRRLMWELGLDRQARSDAERQRARTEWAACLAVRAQATQPNPFLD